MADLNCQLEETIFDLKVFCRDHDCSMEKLLENEMTNIFVLTGVLNAYAAIYYQDTYVEEYGDENLHDVNFDVY